MKIFQPIKSLDIKSPWLAMQLLSACVLFASAMAITPSADFYVLEKNEFLIVKTDNEQWLKKNAAMCKQSDEAIESFKKRLDTYNQDGRVHSRNQLTKLDAQLIQAQDVLNNAKIQGYTNGIIVKEESAKIQWIKQQMAQQEWRYEVFRYELIDDKQLRHWAQLCQSSRNQWIEAQNNLQNAHESQSALESAQIKIFGLALLLWIAGAWISYNQFNFNCLNVPSLDPQMSSE